MGVGSRFYSHVGDLQDRITRALHDLDPALTVTEDLWERNDAVGAPGGGGRTRAFQGDVIENAGVNVSCVFGQVDPAFAERVGGEGDPVMWAAGISLIIHPRNPRVPTVHANFRRIEMGNRRWYGGGADLTPYFPNTADFTHFHSTWEKATRGLGTFAAWKEWCDRYFVNHHRDGEMRGVGGIFFDKFNQGDDDADADTVMGLSESFLPSWLPIAKRRLNEPFTDADVDFQLHRRGRYVEFNLLHDRGTSFGLRSGGRTESILISLPARVRFAYNYRPAEGSPHEEMLTYYRPHDWTGGAS